MYEIWLMLNIVWELAAGLVPWLVALAAVWLALVAVALHRSAKPSAATPVTLSRTAAPGPWRRSFARALVIGIVAGLVAAAVVPFLTQSTLGEARYLVDWLALAGIGAAFGGAVFAWAWPLSAVLGRRQA